MSPVLGLHPRSRFARCGWGIAVLSIVGLLALPATAQTPSTTSTSEAASALDEPELPDPQVLAQGLWIGTAAAGRHVFRFAFEGDRLTGQSYLIRDGKALSAVPVVAASITQAPSMAGTKPSLIVELRLRPGWVFRGRLSSDGTVLEGQLDVGRGGRAQDLRLEHATLDAAPAVLPRPPTPPGQPPWAYRRPAETDDGWRTADAAETGLDLGRIEALITDVMTGKAGLIHSLLVVKGDRLVVEEYFHGFGRDDLHGLSSCTKSVASLLVGLAIQNGQLAGVETPVLQLFPELREGAAEGWEDLNVKHLLEMTSGTAWEGRGRPPAGPALMRAALGQAPVSPVGTRWRYSDLDADLLAAILYRATGVQSDAYAERHLFTPLGITQWDWEIGKEDGFPRFYGTLRLRPRDMAKIGTLVLAGGTWRGREVVAKDWIRESTSEQVLTGDEAYGYLWWRDALPSLPSGVISARGVGSQFIFIVPDLDMVVVVTGGNALNGLDFRIGESLVQHLVPGAAAALGVSEPVPRLERLFEEAAREGLSGSAMLIEGDEVAWRASYGLGDREAGTPIGPATVFYLASVSKQITATAVLQLEEQGLLSTEDTLDRFFETVPDDKKAITVHQLLSHTSGLASMWGTFQEMVDRDEAVARTLASKLEHPPGETFSYSNCGYNLLSVIVERVSGMPFVEYVRERIFKPARMTNTGFVFDRDRWPAEQVAHCYSRDHDNGNHLTWEPAYSHMGSGGVVIGIDDLRAFQRALWSGALIGKASRTKMLTPYRSNYGYGMEIVRDTDNRLFYEHAGYYHGCASLAVYSPESDATFLMLLNDTGSLRVGPKLLAMIRAALR